MFCFSVLFVLFLLFIPVLGFSEEKGSLEKDFVLTGVYLCFDGISSDLPNICKGAFVFDGSLSFKPTDSDELFLRGSFAWKNALNRLNPFGVNIYTDDLSDDLHGINGHGGFYRNNLLELWYARTFKLESMDVTVTGGIIDSARFIDTNRFANDGVTQFMNEVFVNSPVANVVSYDFGLAVSISFRDFGLNLVGMNTKSDDGSIYNWFAGQLSYKVNTNFGEGNYRVYGFVSSKIHGERLYGVGISVDQDLVKDTLGFFLRCGGQNDDSVSVTYKSIISGGIDIKLAKLMKDLHVGIGYGYLDAAKHSDILYTHVGEAYIRFPVFRYRILTADITLDVQYLSERVSDDEEKITRRAVVYGTRLNVRF